VVAGGRWWGGVAVAGWWWAVSRWSAGRGRLPRCRLGPRGLPGSGLTSFQVTASRPRLGDGRLLECRALAGGWVPGWGRCRGGRLGPGMGVPSVVCCAWLPRVHLLGLGRGPGRILLVGLFTFGFFGFFGSLEWRTENNSFISVLKKPEPNFIMVLSVQLVRFRFSVISVRFLGSGSFCPGLSLMP
jgi:hypothetical protein